MVEILVRVTVPGYSTIFSALIQSLPIEKQPCYTPDNCEGQLGAAENQAFISNTDPLEITGYSGAVRVGEQAFNT